MSEFLAFVREAEHIAIPPPSQPPIPEFRGFIDEALPLVVAKIKCLLPRIAERAALAQRWLVGHDLLSVAGCSFAEDSYTELIAWALNPATHPDSAERRQRAWLNALGLDESICVRIAVIPKTQLVTDDGIPDLILQFESATVVVEAKTGSAEHAAPSGELQTIAYPKAVRRALTLTPDHRVEMVFLTSDGKKAANPEARTTTFLEFALCIASLLDNEEMPAETRAAYAMLFTHFLTCATTSSVPVRAVIDDISAWSQQPGWDEDEHVLDRMNDLLSAAEILFPEQTR